MTTNSRSLSYVMGMASLLAVASSCATSDSKATLKEPAGTPRASIDQPVADFRLQDLNRDDPRHVSLSQLRGKTVVLFFLSPQCNTSRGYEGRIGQLLNDYRNKNVTFLGVRSSANDTNDGTRTYVRQKNFDFPVLSDEGSRLADYFKVSNTPTFVVIDPRGRFRYWGAFDDHYDETRAKKRYLRQAIDATLAGKEVATPRGLGLG